MNEADLLHTIRAAARTLGWIEHHDEQSVQLDRVFNPDTGRWASRKRRAISTPGFPDLVLARRSGAWQGVKGTRLLFLELKRDVGPKGGDSHRRLSDAQLEWATALEDLCLSIQSQPGAEPIVRYLVVRPVDLDRIIGILETGVEKR